MTKTNEIAAALANYSNAYRSLVMTMEPKPYNIEAAIQYATADVYNANKHMSDAIIIATINDETAYLTEKLTKEGRA